MAASSNVKSGAAAKSKSSPATEAARPAPAAPASPEAPNPATTTSSAPDPLADLIPLRSDTLVFPPFEELTMLLYGEPDSGKTTFASGNKKSFFIATEPGQDFVKAPVRRVFRWSADTSGKDRRHNFCDMIRALWKSKKDGTLTYTTVNIDIVDNLYQMCLEDVCYRKGIDYPPENDFGKTWKEIRAEWEFWLRKLMDIVNVTLITHCAGDKQELEIQPGVKKEISRLVPTFKGNKAAQFLDGILNAHGFVHKNAAGQRVITFRSDPTLGTKDRTGILSQLGTLPLEYDKVAAAYAAKAKELGYEIKSKWT